MIVTTTDSIPGRVIVRTIGLVRGNTVRGADLNKDITAWLKNLVGGEIEEYTKLLAESREQALDRMVEDARARGADAIVGMRFVTAEIADGAAEFLAFGTGVVLAPQSAESHGEG